MSDTDEMTKEKQGSEEKGSEDHGSEERDWKAEAEKWKALARKHEAQAKANAEAARRLREAEEAEKTVAERLADAQRRAQEAELRALRHEVAAERGLPPKLARFLHGSSREELEEAAAELLEAIKPADTGGSPGTGNASTKPRERLRPGAGPDVEPEELDPRKLVAGIPRRPF
ncbi:MAG TPA: hypothetical protein VNO79_01990 [Actinomycetota bacterium]|nr:hypothetical protein [Actinomycetota bacterium]